MASSTAVQSNLPLKQRKQKRRLFHSSSALFVLGAVILGTPMLLGGALAVSVPICTTLALCALTLSGVPSEPLRRNWFALSLLLMIGVTSLQLVPLPPLFLRFFAPTNAALTARTLYPLDGTAVEYWRPIHLDPGNGRADLQYFFGLLAAYLCAQQLARRGHGAAIGTIATVSAVWCSALAMAHWFMGIDKVFGFYTPVEAHPPILSPILNPNHLAAFTGAGTLLCIGHVATPRTTLSKALYASGAVLCGLVCTLTLSRSGIAVAASSLLFFALWISKSFLRNSKKNPATESRTFSAALLVYVVVVVVLLFSFELLQQEYATRNTTKLTFVAAGYRSLVRYWFFGVGSGGTYAALSATQHLPAELTFDRVEHLPADVLLAFGIPAGSVVLLLGIRWFWNVKALLKQKSEATTFNTAVFFALFALYLHDLLDHSLWFGATGYLAVVLAGYLSGEYVFYRNGTSQSGSNSALTGMVFIACLLSIFAGFITSKGTLYQDRELTRRETHSAPPVAVLRARILRHPADPYLVYGTGILAANNQHPAALRFFNRALELAPHWSQPHLFLVGFLDRRGLRNQALLEARLSVERSTSTHETVGRLLRRIAITPDQLAQCTPDGSVGSAFLRTVATQQEDALAVQADALLLERHAADAAVLTREAQRARQRGNIPQLRTLSEQLVRQYPTLAVGYLNLAELQQAQAPEQAVTLLQNALPRLSAGDRPAVWIQLGRLYTQSRSVDRMRNAMAQLLREAGSNIDARINALGALGSYELLLQNDLAALNAFELADAMSHPEHRYVVQLLSIAERMGDLARMRGACITLQEYGQPNAEQRALCSRIERSTTAPATSL